MKLQICMLHDQLDYYFFFLFAEGCEVVDSSRRESARPSAHQLKLFKNLSNEDWRVQLG